MANKSPNNLRLRRDRSVDNSVPHELEIGADVNGPLVQMMKKVLKVSSINEIKKLVDGGDWPESTNSRDRDILVREDFQVYRGTMTEDAAPTVGKGGSRQRSAANRTHIDK